VPRPRKTDLPDLSQRCDLTAGAIERLTCPPGKLQAFLRDSEAPALRVRVTAAGAKSFVFEAKLDRQTIRRTIGDVRNWTVPAARAEARRLAVVLDGGHDPRELERQQRAAEAAGRAALERQSVAARDAWNAYVEDRRPHWGDRHYQDHLIYASPGGAPGKRVTALRPGALAPLLALPLRDLTPQRVEEWAAVEAKTRPTVARLAWRLLKAFFNWCGEHPDYSAALPAGNPARTKRARESLGSPGVKSDALQREQLPAWFAAVCSIHNPVVAAYLQTVLLTGARPGEVIAMRWGDLDFVWKRATIRDKVEGARDLPLTPFVAGLLYALPRRGEFVFAGRRRPIVAAPNAMHTAACQAAGLPPLTLHGLRRSFKSLTEWLDIPAGVVAQLMGHKPSATAERHYTVRPLDLLRMHHERIEVWILNQAGIEFVPPAAGPRLVAAGG
jgi:integrase